jgi:Aldehyde dehydrogenase family
MDLAATHGRLSAAARDFLPRRHKLLIDGQWVEARSGKTFAVLDPATGQQIAAVAEGGPEDIELAVAAARRAFEDGPWARLKPTERGKLVWKLGDVLEAHADALRPHGGARRRHGRAPRVGPRQPRGGGHRPGTGGIGRPLGLRKAWRTGPSGPGRHRWPRDQAGLRSSSAKTSMAARTAATAVGTPA